MDNGSICLIVVFLVIVVPKIFFIDTKLSSIKDFFRVSLIEYLGTDSMKFFKKTLIQKKKIILKISLFLFEFFTLFFCVLFYFMFNDISLIQYTIYYFVITFLFVFFIFLSFYLVNNKLKKFDIPIKINKKKLKEKILGMSNYFILPNQINNLTLLEVQRTFFIKEKINLSSGILGAAFFDSYFSSDMKKVAIDNVYCNRFMQTNLFNLLKGIANPIYILSAFLPKLVAIFILSKKDKKEFYAINQVTQEKIHFDDYYNLWKKVLIESIIEKH